MSLIARMKHISPTTVIRILRNLRPKTVSLNQPLPEVVCFDEFKSVKNVSGAMSFVMMDGKTHQLIDIVENRQLNPLRDYFLRYPRKVREQVRLVVSDFYTPYRTLVKECFPNARIVADRFHISQHIGRAFTNHRIQVMKTFKKGSSVEALKEILETTSKECVGIERSASLLASVISRSSDRSRDSRSAIIL